MSLKIYITIQRALRVKHSGNTPTERMFSLMIKNNSATWTDGLKKARFVLLTLQLLARGDHHTLQQTPDNCREIGLPLYWGSFSQPHSSSIHQLDTYSYPPP
jgi:hypothetical protein